MRCFLFAALFAVAQSAASTESLPAGWKLIKDAKSTCKIAVPDTWTPSEHPGSAVFNDATIGIAVVTAQPGQTLKPLTPSLQRTLGIPKEKLFENSAERIFYQDKIAKNADDTNSFSVMVPGKDGTCSSRVVFPKAVAEEVAKKIALSVGPVPAEESH